MATRQADLFVRAVSARVRKYNKEILYRFLEGKLWDSKLSFWWQLLTTNQVQRFFKEINQESRLEQTKPSRNPALRRRLAGS